MKSYRCYKKETPMSSWGHAMFNDDMHGLSGYGEILYSVEKDELTNVNDIMDDIIELIEIEAETNEDVAFTVNMFPIHDLFNPDDMVIDACAYDNDALFTWLWETIIEPRGIRGLATFNGAIVFDETLIKVEGPAANFEDA